MASPIEDLTTAARGLWRDDLVAFADVAAARELRRALRHALRQVEEFLDEREEA